jgi:hypothetical protein
VRSPRCPLCSAPVVDDGALAEHLALVHDLVDDPGTSTHLADLDEHNQARAAGGPRHRSGPPLPPSASLRVYDPGGDDARWRYLVLGVGGLLLLLATAYALSLS